MNKIKTIILYFFTSVLLVSCAGVSESKMFRNDENQVTIGHGTGAVLRTKYDEASAYCAKYSKNAYLRGQIDPHYTVFDCR